MRTLYGKTDSTRESQFLREVDKSLLTGHAVYERKKAQGSGRNWSDGYSSETVFKPFEQLKYAKQDIKKAAASYDKSFNAGDKVNHTKFGDGLVIDTDFETVSVMFDSVGLKKLSKNIAPIKILEKQNE